MTTNDESKEVLESTNERRIETPFGNVFVRDIPGQEPPFVLMHGFPDDHRIYDKILSLLSPRRVLVFDWLGYGRSDRTDGSAFTLESHVSQITSVLNALGIDRAVLVGHDASGPDSVGFAISHPERIAHLVLLNTYFGHRPAMKLPEMIRLLAEPSLAALADAMVNDEAQRLWLLLLTARLWGMDATFEPDNIATRSILPQFFGDASQPDALGAVRAWTANLFSSLDAQDLLIESGALQRLGVPVSLIFGEEDRYLNPSLASEIAELFKAPSLHLLQGASHWPQDDQPDLVAQLLRDSLES